MAINIFEGARRVVKLVGVLWIVGVVAENADEIAPLFERKLDLGDKIVLAYTVSFLGQAPIRIGAEYIPTEGITTEQALKMLDDKSIAEPICDSFHVRTRKGTEATVGLCYREQKARPITGMAVNKAPAELRHETVGNLAIKNARNSFVLSPQDEAWIDSQLWTARWELIQRFMRHVAPWLFGGLVSLWVVTWTIGWIVRGFIGIPRGSDRRLTDG